MMKKYKLEMVVSYWQTIEVEAENVDEAKQIAFDAFDITKAREGEGEIYDVQEMPTR